MSYEITFTFDSEDQFRLWWCRLIRARVAWRHGIRDGNVAKIVYGSTWTDALMLELGSHGPPGLEAPTGNETQKP